MLILPSVDVRKYIDKDNIYCSLNVAYDSITKKLHHIILMDAYKHLWSTSTE